MDLNGKTCLVTGGNRGIGRGIVERLAQEDGVRVLVGVRSLDRYEPVEGRGAAEIRPVVVDLSSPERIETCWNELGDERERLDVLVNNAGQFTAGQLETQDMATVYALFQSTLLGPIHLTRLALPGMLARGGGKIVNNSSVVAYANFPAVSTYAAAKSGVAGFTESLRRELAATPLSVLHVVTGGIDTDMMDDVKAQLREHFPSSDSWDQHTPSEWGAEIVEAILSDKTTLGPGGKAALGKLASHLPSFVLDAVTERAFKRT